MVKSRRKSRRKSRSHKRRKSRRKSNRKSRRKSKRKSRRKSKRKSRKKSKRKTVRKPRKPNSEGCINHSHLAKYRDRKSPPYPANDCRGRIKIGNDGEMWRSKASSNGVYRWVKA